VQAWRPTGLAARILAVLAATSALTLVAAAFALTSPLEHKLRAEELDELSSSAAAARGSLQSLERGALRAGSPRLAGRARAIARRAEARTVVFAPDGRVLADTDPDGPARPAGLLPALRTRRVADDTLTLGGRRIARVGEAVPIDGRRYVVVLTRSLAGAHSAAGVVRRALPRAALFGVVAALLLGALLSTRLVRRLRVLRDAALRTAEHGAGAGALPADRSRDEVGDLTRAFATMQERLHDQEEARRTFVATASHELRTPLASLHLMLDLLDEELAEREPAEAGAREQLAHAEAQVRRLESLAADLLDLSRIDAGLPFAAEPVDLREVGAAVAAEFEGGRGHGDAVRLPAPGEAVWALADPGAVARIARILLDNALRFAPAETPVELAVGRLDDGAWLSVTDRGPGVLPDERDTIFDRFRRGSAAHDGGFGLGLPIARELARRMGGDVELLSAGGPTTFRLALPAAGAALTEPQPDVSRAQGRGRHRPVHG
jgi:signal transduction histidine kinase